MKNSTVRYLSIWRWTRSEARSVFVPEKTRITRAITELSIRFESLYKRREAVIYAGFVFIQKRR